MTDDAQGQLFGDFGRPRPGKRRYPASAAAKERKNERQRERVRTDTAARERKNERQRERYRSDLIHRERRLEQGRMWYIANREWRIPQSRAWAIAHPGLARATRYGISVDQSAALLAIQGGVCAIGRESGRLHIDHDSRCCPGKAVSCGRCIRGILCLYCNTNVLGVADRRPDLVQPIGRLAWYLDRGYARFGPDGRVWFERNGGDRP